MKTVKLGSKILVRKSEWGLDVVEKDTTYSDKDTLYEYTLTAIKEVKVVIE